jgi:succinyl-diaminopimelate desuccinylase
MHSIDRVVAEIDRASDEIVAFTQALVRVPSVNPPGEEYEACARVMGAALHRQRFEVEYIAADGLPEHTARYPRLNVIGTRRGSQPGPAIHLNGHIDVVPAGAGWSVEPFAGVVKDGRIYGRGVCDMKAGIAAAMFAVAAIDRAGIRPPGTIDISGTVDEESGGFAGVAHLARIGRISHRNTDAVIIPEPLNVDRICVGHRGVYWFELTTHGRVAHGSMPFLGVSAVDGMAEVLTEIHRVLEPALGLRLTAMPVVPEAARRATINVNGIEGGQPVNGVQTPCVADRCRAVFDRRFLIEEGFEVTRREIVSVIDRAMGRLPGVSYELRDLMVVDPVQTPTDAPVVGALDRAIRRVLGAPPSLVASPGTFDQKHFARIAGVHNCVAYGPGQLELAHQPDEYCEVVDLIKATKIIALAVLDLAGAP